MKAVLLTAGEISRMQELNPKDTGPVAGGGKDPAFPRGRGYAAGVLGPGIARGAAQVKNPGVQSEAV